MGLHLGRITTRIAIFDLHVAAGGPSELPEPLPEILKIALRVRIVLGDSQQYGDPPNPCRRLLRACRERRRSRSTTEQPNDPAPVNIAHGVVPQRAASTAQRMRHLAPSLV